MNRPRLSSRPVRRARRRVVAAPSSQPSLTVVSTEEAPPAESVSTAASVSAEVPHSPGGDLTMPVSGAAASMPPAGTTSTPRRADPPETDRRAGGPSAPVSMEGAAVRSGNRIEEFLGFQLDAEEYCVWIRSVKEIIKPSEVTPIPRGPRHIVGLISLRGAIVPIFDIRGRLGLPDHPVTPQSRVVVFMLDAGAVGIVVDRVTEVMSVDPGALEPPPPTLGECEAAFVTATLRFKQRLIGVLHLDRLVTMASTTTVRAAA